MSVSQKWTKRPVTVTAWQVDNSDRESLYKLLDWIGVNRLFLTTDGKFRVDTLEGSMWARDGDYIIQGVQGEFYPCKPDIFLATYEAVGEWP